MNGTKIIGWRLIPNNGGNCVFVEPNDGYAENDDGCRTNGTCCRGWQAQLLD